MLKLAEFELCRASKLCVWRTLQLTILQYYRRKGNIRVLLSSPWLIHNYKSSDPSCGITTF